MRREKAAAAALVVMAALFGLGLLGLFRDRYAKGDVYRPYSSFRTDPLGARAFHDALVEIEGLSVLRNVRPLSRLASGPETAVLFLGVAGDALDRPDQVLANAVESQALAGARVVVTLVADERPTFAGDEDAADRGKPAAPDPSAAADPRGAVPLPTLAQRWGLETAPCPQEGEGGAPGRRALRLAPGPLPGEIDWRGTRCLASTRANWTAIYGLGGGPVLAERRLGPGSLVLALDSYFVSNEGLRAGTGSELMSWLLGSATTVVFDEVHLGVEEHHGVGWLLRRYRLHGCAAVLVVLAGLAIWRAASPLVPPAASVAPRALASGPLAAAGGEAADDRDNAGDGEVGREASAGLEDLLRRGLPPGRLLDACFDEWRRSFARRQPDLDAALRALDCDRRNPVAAYREARRVVLERRGKHER